MEKQKMEEKAMEENKKTNPDSERKQKLVSAVLMAFVCILLMGGGTYAWFTMSNTARVNSLKLNVASEGKLYISENSDFTVVDNKTSDIPWPDATNEKTLFPCTTEDGIKMKKPIYTSEKVVGFVTDIDTSSTSTEKDMYYLEQVFYLYMDEMDNKPLENQTYNVYLVQNDNANSKTDGTYFDTKNGGLCARVSFQLKDATSVAGVYEPNYDETIENPTKADGPDLTVVTSTHKQKQAGTFDATTVVADKPANEGDSPKLFEITGDTATQVTVRIWFEGTDEQCCNEIALNEIKGQLKFVANKTTTSTSGGSTGGDSGESASN